MQRRGYRWWTARLARTFELFDLARVDHFRGFVQFWAVPSDAETAMEGHWEDGPGAAVFDAAAAALGELPVVADLVPPRHGPLVPVGQVADQVSVRIPNVPAGAGFPDWGVAP